MAFQKISSMLFVGVALAGCASGPPADLSAVIDFDVNRYLGTWYEIARLDHRFERGLSRVTADYSLNDNGTIKVVNRGYNAEKNKWSSVEGKAKFRGDKAVGSLKVSFFGPFYGGYHILELDEDYQHALVAGSSKAYLWILARSPEMDQATYKYLLEKASDLGFQTDELVLVSHGGGTAIEASQ